MSEVAQRTSLGGDVAGTAGRGYGGWQRERVDFLFGLSGQRAALLCVSVLLGTAPLALSRPRLVLLFWPAALVLAGGAFVRIAGRPIIEWLSVAVSYELIRVRGQHRFLSGPFGHLARRNHSMAVTTSPPHTSAPALERHSAELPASPEDAGGWIPQPPPGIGAVSAPHHGLRDPGLNRHAGVHSRQQEHDRQRRQPLRRATLLATRSDMVMQIEPKEWPLDLPGILAPLILLEAHATSPASALRANSPGGPPIAMAYHRLARTYTAAARISYPGMGLAGPARQNRQAAGWGALLSSLCTEGSPIIRVQTVQRIVPASPAVLRAWHDAHAAAGAPGIAVQVATDLMQTAGTVTSQRDSFLAFTFDARRARSAIRAAGGGHQGAATVVLRQLRQIGAAVHGADLTLESWLTARDLAEVIRTAFDPHAGSFLSARRATSYGGQHLRAGVAPAAAGPAAALTRPGSYAHDGAVSATFWVEEWPASQVPATVLAPLLGDPEHRRSVSLHLEPLSPRAAGRQVMRERTARTVAVRLRQRSGQIVPEDEHAALARAAGQDADRAAGHGLVRFTGYVTVTVTDEDDLENACAELEADAAACQLGLQRMWFTQDIGFAVTTLPLGLGLPARRW